MSLSVILRRSASRVISGGNRFYGNLVLPGASVSSFRQFCSSHPVNSQDGESLVKDAMRPTLDHSLVNDLLSQLQSLRRDIELLRNKPNNQSLPTESLGGGVGTESVLGSFDGDSTVKGKATDDSNDEGKNSESDDDDSNDEIDDDSSDSDTESDDDSSDSDTESDDDSSDSSDSDTESDDDSSDSSDTDTESDDDSSDESDDDSSDANESDGNDESGKDIKEKSSSESHNTKDESPSESDHHSSDANDSDSNDEAGDDINEKSSECQNSEDDSPAESDDNSPESDKLLPENKDTEELLKGIQSEILSAKNCIQLSAPDAVFPVDFPFKLLSDLNNGTGPIYLSREYEGELVEMKVGNPRVHSDTVDYQKKKDSAFGMDLTVVVSSMSSRSKKVEYKCTARKDGISIFTVRDRAAYGSDYNDVVSMSDFNENLKEEFAKYLEARGVTISTTNFLYGYMLDRANKQRLRILENIQEQLV